jgi:hypothetical protein
LYKVYLYNMVSLIIKVLIHWNVNLLQ